MTGTKGFIVDVFGGRRDGRTVVYATGRSSADAGDGPSRADAASPSTFGLVDDRVPQALWLRAADATTAAAVLSRHCVAPLPSPRTTMHGDPLVEVRALDDLQLGRIETALRNAGIRTYEADLDAATRWLVTTGVRGCVALDGAARESAQVGKVYANPTVKPCDYDAELRVLALDIETDVVRGNAVLAVSLVAWGGGQPETEEVLVVDPPGAREHGDGPRTEGRPEWYVPCPSEPDLLHLLSARVRAIDPDVVTGWNADGFDLPVLLQRYAHHRLAPELQRTKGGETPPASAAPARRIRAALRGRQLLDALRLVRMAMLRLEDLKLGTVAQVLLGRTKTTSAEEWEDKPALILQQYEQDRVAFAEYCLEDSRLVRDILRKKQLVELTVSRSRLIGLPLARTWGSVASFELIYMTELRRRGVAAPTFGVDQEDPEGVPGGLVLEPKGGLHHGVLVFDFKSLYPSVIRTFNIDPLAHARAPADGDAIVAPNGARFARERGILPEILDRFFESRENAKKRGDDVASYAYKIIMNSFYGVLGTSNCRFASPELAGAITGFGQEMLRWARDWFLARGMAVLYGDTDSLFVRGDGDGETLAAEVNAALGAHLRERYGVESKLELEFEKRYAAFFLPSMRGGAGGRAKSYAGLNDGALEITGMEAVRRDWTRLARDLQTELLGLLFRGEHAAMTARIKAVVADVRAGKRDAALVYRKSIRKPLASYTSTTPPHVKAARLLPRPTRVVRYVMTVEGPQPVGFVKDPLDYEHYIEKQLTPIVEQLADVAGYDAEAALGGTRAQERSLFGD